MHRQQYEQQRDQTLNHTSDHINAYKRYSE